MGTPEFAVPSLEACLDVGEVVAVVTQPDKPKGRGQEISSSPVKAAAQARGLTVLQPAKIRGTPFPEEVRALRPDVGVVTAYGKILPQELLDAPARGCVNVHASLLPRFRGAAPIQWAIASGDAVTGVCLMKMDAGMDTGPVIDRRQLPIRPEDTAATLHDALSRLGAALVRESLPRYLAGELEPAPQPREGVVMAPLIRKEDGRLDFTRPAAELERRTRAFHPWPGTYVYLGGRVLKVTRARVGAGRGAPGEVLDAGGGGIEVACQEGSLVLLEVQPEGKRVMSAQQFLAGHPLAKGSRPFEGGGP
ncbi:MAG TPA: methionyl-tRNA formyltransferase [Myxococcales bacterium]|nr:methionyl-tRNA formyltransferase [Myxococcales bacterium]